MLIYSMSVSVDGFIADREGAFGWSAPSEELFRFHTALISELVCYGLTLWEFRPLVQENGAIGWKLVQTLAKELRAAEQALAGLRSSSPEARGSAG